jgi:hypothetical protein
LSVDREPGRRNRPFDELLLARRINSFPVELGFPLSDPDAQPVGEFEGGPQIEQAAVDDVVLRVDRESRADDMPAKLQSATIESELGGRGDRRAGQLILRHPFIRPARLQAYAEPEKIVARAIVELQALIAVREFPGFRRLFRVPGTRAVQRHQATQRCEPNDPRHPPGSC